MEEKTYVDDIDRSIYDIKNDEKDVYRIQEGLTPEIVTEISKKKKDPSWMEIFRLQSLHEGAGLGTVPGGAGYGAYCDLCKAEYPYERQMVQCAGGNKEYL